MPTLEQTLIDRSGRWNTIPSLKPAFAAVTRALDVHTKFKAKAAEIAADTHKTEIGKRDAMQKFTAEHSHELVRARKSVDVMKAKLSQRRAKLMPPPPSPTDFAAAVTRGEIRAYLRGIKNPGERLKMLLDPNVDISFMDAALEMPDVMSGINEQMRELITQNVIERRHPGALADLEMADEAIEMVGVAAQVAFDTARDAGQFPNSNVLTAFVDAAVGNTLSLEADINRNFETMADAA